MILTHFHIITGPNSSFPRRFLRVLEARGNGNQLPALLMLQRPRHWLDPRLAYPRRVWSLRPRPRSALVISNSEQEYYPCK